MKIISHTRFFIYPLIISCLIIGAFSCSKSNVPTMPSENSLPISASDSPGHARSDMEALLGSFDLYINSDHDRAEILPSRDLSEVGDSWVTEMTNFFIWNPCTDCFSIKGISLDSFNDVVLKLQVRHPFPPGDQFQEPSPRNRDDVRIFDTRLVVAHKHGDGPEFTEFGKKLSNTLVINPDGYTDIIDPVYDQIGNRPEDTHPYIILFEDKTEGNVNPDAPTGFDDLLHATGHNVMNQGAESETELTLDLVEGINYELKLYIVASYGQSAQDFTYRLNPKYYLPEYNSKEPWKVEVALGSNSLVPGNTDSMVDVIVKVWDWQHGATVNSALTHLDDIRSSSDIQSVDLEVPALFDGIISLTKPDLDSTGRDDKPLVYRFDVYNQKACMGGDISGLVRVVDSRELNQNVATDEDGIYNSGFGLIEYEIPAFNTYQFFELNFNMMQNVPPIAKFTTSPSGDPLIVGRDDEIHLDATDSYDVDGSVATYEWDFNYDGSDFHGYIGYDSAIETWSYSGAGTYRLALRVKDNTIPIMSDIIFKWVIVLPETSNIAPRLICPVGIDCDNLFYASRNPIRTDGINVYIPVGGLPYGERYILVSEDYGGNFSDPIKVSFGLDETSTKHTGDLEINPSGAVSFLYFDEYLLAPSAWMILAKSPNGQNWGLGLDLSASTDSDYVMNSDFLFGQNDREFIFFESIIDLSGGNGRSTMNYLHRSDPSQQFQDRPIVLKQSGLPVTQSRFRNPCAAIDSSGNVLLTFAEFSFEGTIVDPYSVIFCRISPDGSTVTKNPTRINDIQGQFAQKYVSLAVDGSAVYVVFTDYYILSELVDILLLKSTDSGETWAPSIKITDYAIQGGFTDHPVNIAVDQNHVIHVTWADTRGLPYNDFRNIWYDYSTDGGNTWNTDQMIYGDGIDGDQTDPGIAVDYLNRIHIVWWNNDLTAGQGVWHTRFIH